jgi:hypothetical protein
MPLTTKHDPLTAIRTLVDYVKEKEGEDYLEQLGQGAGEGHVYLAIAEVDKWLSSPPHVLHMVAGCDDSCLPYAVCEVLTAQEAAKRFEELLDDQELPSLPYNPATDEVLARYEPTDASGYRCYGFAPLGDGSADEDAELAYESSEIPLDCWQVKVNGTVVYQQPEEDEGENEMTKCESMSGEEDCSAALVESRP